MVQSLEAPAVGVAIIRPSVVGCGRANPSLCSPAMAALTGGEGTVRLCMDGTYEHRIRSFAVTM